MKKVLFIASTGGHLTELLQLKPMFTDYDYLLVTEKTKTTMSLKNDFKVKYVVFGTKDHLLSYLFKFTYNILLSIIYFISFSPDVIVTTGTHTAVPMCYLAHFFKKKVIYIETFANSKSPTQAGKIIYPIADVFIVQWESMKEFYPKAIVGGWIF